MIDRISSLVCAQLNANFHNWTCATYPNNKRPWARIFQTTWLNYAVAGDLVKAFRNGHPIEGQYPIFWFELVQNHNLIIRVPLGTKGFRRPAACDAYDGFLHALIDNNNNRWQTISDESTNYLNQHEIQRINVDQQIIVGRNNNERSVFVTRYISEKIPFLDEVFEALV